MHFWTPFSVPYNKYKGKHSKRKNIFVKKSCFNHKTHFFGIFKRYCISIYMKNLYEYVKCTDDKGQMTKLDMLAISQNYNVKVFYVILRKPLAKNAFKSYHVYKVMAMLHIYNGIFSIRSTGYPAKIKTCCL